MAEVTPDIQFVTLNDFSMGFVTRRLNPLNYPPTAVLDGVDMDLSDGEVKTRAGIVSMSDRVESSAPLDNAAVQFLAQVRFPTVEATFLIAQQTTKIWACADHLPLQDGTGEWTLLYTFPNAVAGPITLAQLNERVVIAERNNVPVVWGGGLTTTGADWPLPKRVLVSYDEGVNFEDISNDVCDSDAGTSETITVLAAADTHIYVCLDMPQCEGLYLSITGGAPNGMTIEYYTSATGWEEVGITTDNTIVATISLSQAGTIVFDGVYEPDYSEVGTIPGFWFRFILPPVPA